MCAPSAPAPAPAAAPPPPTNTPAPAGNDANQRFQQARAGLAGGVGGTIVDPGNSTSSLSTAKGATVLGGTSS